MVESLKKNEAEMVEALKKLSDKRGNPFVATATDIKVLFTQVHVIKTAKKFKPSRSGKIRMLHRLAKKGVLTMDTKNPRKPIIKLNP